MNSKAPAEPPSNPSAPHYSPFHVVSRPRPLWHQGWFLVAVLVIIGCVAYGISHRTASSETGDIDSSWSTDDWLKDYFDYSANDDEGWADETDLDDPSTSNPTPTELSDDTQDALDYAQTIVATIPVSKKDLERTLAEDYSEAAVAYAIANVAADWNANALQAANDYRDVGDFNDEELYEILTSDIDGFIPEEAKYAVEHANPNENHVP